MSDKDNDEAAALAALQGDDNEATKTEPATEPEASPPEEVAQEQMEEGASVSDGEGSPEQRGADNDGEDGNTDDGGAEPLSHEGDKGAAIATLDDVRRMDVHRDWVKTLVPRIPKGVTIDDEGSMLISADAENEDLARMVQMFSEADLRASKMSIRCKWYIALGVFELVERHGTSISQAIDELGLCEGTGRGFDTVYSWCKAFSELPDECFHPNLTMSHLVRAARVKKPKEGKALKKFNKKRIELLKEAANDPTEISAKQIERELKQITAKLDKDEPSALKKESLGVIHDRLIDSYRVYRLAEVDPSVLENNGIKMADLVNQIETDENELINRHKIIEDAAQIVLHWTDAPTLDAEVIEPKTEGEEDGSENNETDGENEGEGEEANQDSESVEEKKSSRKNRKP
jgi:hypothetical protein